MQCVAEIGWEGLCSKGVEGVYLGKLKSIAMMVDSFLRKVRSELLDGFKTTKTCPSEGSYEET